MFTKQYRSPLPYALSWPRGQVTSYNLWGGSGQSIVTRAHVQSPGRQLELRVSGKFVTHNMYYLQFYSDLFSLWIYPFAEFKRYHTRLIESESVSKRASPEPQLGLIFVLQLLTLVSAAYAHSSQPVVDLNTGFNTYDIHFGDRSFQLAFQENGIVMSHSSLVRRHQLMSISRHRYG